MHRFSFRNLNFTQCLLRFLTCIVFYVIKLIFFVSFIQYESYLKSKNAVVLENDQGNIWLLEDSSVIYRK